MKRGVGPGFLKLGLIFLVVGFIQQDYSLSFESGFFNLGVMFTLSGAVVIALKRRSQKE